MPQKIRMWEITQQNTLAEISSDEINLEQRLEDWLESDISMIDPDLMVIGRQVRTDFGGEIDLLCLDSKGDSVVVELKKGRTPRDVTAQALDYSSWVKGLSFDQITDIAERYDNLGGTLEEAFQEKFEEALPDILNQNHRSLIVAGAMDESTERIVRYLSDMNVPINVATVQYFKSIDGKELLAQVFLVEPEIAEARAQSSSKRQHDRATVASVQAIADNNGVGELHRHLRSRVRGLLSATAYRNRIWYQLTRDDGGRRMLLVARPGESDAIKGLSFELLAHRLMQHYGVSRDALNAVLPEDCKETDVSGWLGLNVDEKENSLGFEGYFRSAEEIDKFMGLLSR